MPNANDLTNALLESVIESIESLDIPLEDEHPRVLKVLQQDQVWLQEPPDKDPTQQKLVSVLGGINQLHDFETQRGAERLRQARLSFNAALILLIIGTLIVLTGVILLFKVNI